MVHRLAVLLRTVHLAHLVHWHRVVRLHVIVLLLRRNLLHSGIHLVVHLVVHSVRRVVHLLAKHLRLTHLLWVHLLAHRLHLGWMLLRMLLLSVGSRRVRRWWRHFAVGHLIYLLAHRLIHRLVHRLIHRLIYLLAHRLIHWLTHRLTGHFHLLLLLVHVVLLLRILTDELLLWWCLIVVGRSTDLWLIHRLHLTVLRLWLMIVHTRRSGV